MLQDFFKKRVIINAKYTPDGVSFKYQVYALRVIFFFKLYFYFIKNYDRLC